MEVELHRLDRRYEGLRITQPGGRFSVSLLEDGQQQPAAVVEGEGGRYILIDGYRRVNALRSLGRDTVEVIVLPLTEVEALMWRYRMQIGGRSSALEEAWLLRELSVNHRLLQAELARRLGRSETRISRRLDLVRVLPERVQELVQQGRICPYGAQKCLVPLARAKRADCEQLADGLANHRVSSRQIERLYLAWRGGDAEQRERLVENPMLFFNALAEAEKPEPASLDEAMSVDLEMIASLARRVRRRLTGRLPALPLPNNFPPAWRAARVGFDVLTSTVEPILDAGPRHPNGGAAAAR